MFFGICNTAFICTIYDFFQAGNAVRYSMVSHFYADVVAAHFMGHGRRGAGTEEGIQNKVARIRSHI